MTNRLVLTATFQAGGHVQLRWGLRLGIFCWPASAAGTRRVSSASSAAWAGSGGARRSAAASRTVDAAVAELRVEASVRQELSPDRPRVSFAVSSTGGAWPCDVLAFRCR
ncbi:hypothetical protein [Streptomyces sp. NA02950]|uniref:hypothetical protein n=1 Tax=Streptomyces sp. NA02950 TaxID=2742137 RepID=UPI0020CB6A2B|nr:hypothetical protein [Streptomyces sp. NA02950]